MHGTGDDCHTDLEALQALLATRELALFLDVDGTLLDSTLLDIAVRPDAVRVTAQLSALLESLLALKDCAVALVSGRRLADIDQLFAPLQIPAAGLHGLERRDARGIVHATDLSAGLDAARHWLATHADPRLLVEDKAVHRVALSRAAGTGAGMHGACCGGAARASAGWQLVPGRMCFEIRIRGIGKRDALEAFLAEEPFRGRHAAFFGDDVTDEEGFEYMNAIHGSSVHVGNTAERGAFPLA